MTRKFEEMRRGMQVRFICKEQVQQFCIPQIMHLKYYRFIARTCAPSAGLGILLRKCVL